MEVLGRLVIVLAAVFINYSYGDVLSNTLDMGDEAKENHLHHLLKLGGNTLPPLFTTPAGPVPCVCGVFLSGQFTKGIPPKGNPALMHELMETFPCTPFGNKQCTNKCLDSIVKHLPNSPAILCGSVDRDCFKERAYLFTKNCNDTWMNSNFSAGREYCCKDGVSYKCPVS